MHEIELAGAGPDPGGGHPERAVEEPIGIGQPRRHAGHEDEGLGGVGEAEIPVGQVLVDGARDMVDEDHHQGQATEHIKTLVAAG